MGLIHLIRLVGFGVVILFSIIVLGLAANIDALYDADVTFASLALAVSIITLVTIVPIVAIEHLRKGAFTSIVFVELIWVGILWVLWLASGAEAASLGVDPSLCNSRFLSSTGKTICSSVVSITAFSFINWLILMGWFITLLVFSIIGNHWHSSVADTDILKRNTSFSGASGTVTDEPKMSADPGAASPYNSYQGGAYQQPGQQAYPPSPQGHTPGTVPV